MAQGVVQGEEVEAGHIDHLVEDITETEEDTETFTFSEVTTEEAIRQRLWEEEVA